MTKKAQLLFVPAPGIGHLLSTVEFAKLLVDRDHRLSITIFIMKFPFDTTVDAYTKSFASNSERIHFINLPEDQMSNSESSRPNMLTIVGNQKPHIKEAVSNLIDSNSGPDSPRLAGFILDMFCTTIIDVANEFGVPAFVFYTSGAAFLGLMIYLHTLHEQDNVDITAFKDSGTELAVPSFVNPVPSKVLPSVVLSKEWQLFFLNYCAGIRRAKGVIVNTFEELESFAVHSFSKGDLPIFPVGPILNLNGGNPLGQDRARQGFDIIKWLDDLPPSSVIFLCFGSMGSFEEDQVREIARALENSGVRFLWSLRKPPPKGSRALPSDYSSFDEVLPEGFLDRTAGIGRVIGWAPQTEILAHQAIGGFVSHCGWNSTLESIYFGVPIATWPLYAEQQTNAFELVCELGMGVEIALDYRVEMNGERNGLLSAERIEKGIRKVMEEDSEVRKRVKEMSEKSRKTLIEGGCSYSSLGRLIDDIMTLV